MLGDRCSSHASATCIGVDPSLPTTSDRVEDCSGVNPPSGKNGKTPLDLRHVMLILAYLFDNYVQYVQVVRNCEQWIPILVT
jgi:hypothetical protein